MGRGLYLLLAVLALAGIACDEKPAPRQLTCNDDQVVQDGKCVSPGANCTADAKGSIVADCATKNRVCHEDEIGAFCGVCVEGFVADGEACRKRVACADLGCEAKGRSCLSGGDGDATCGGCLAGSVEKGADCVAVSCDPNDPDGPGATCRAQKRVCTDSAGGPTCGDCWAGHVDASGTCRPARTCGDASCKLAQRLCTPATDRADAVCGDCRAGYRDDAGLCVLRAGTTCDAGGGADSILAACAAEHRGCAVTAEGAACTGCEAGYGEDPDSGTCVQDVPCDQLDCAARNRACEQTPFGRCTGCAAGFVEDPANGTCRAAVTCASLTCGEGTSCMEGGPGEDAECVPSCGPGTIRDGDLCAPCPPCAGEGEDGVDTSLTMTGYCICKTQPGYFYSVSGDVGTFPCDADADGWVRESARNALTSTDPVLVRNARCQVRQIEAFELVAEDGSTKRETLRTKLAMFETDRNDDDRLLAAIFEATGIPPHGRAIQAAELNRLTKMCHTRRADYNDNGVPDVEEWGGQDLAPTMRPEQRPFNEYSYFSELNTGVFVPSVEDTSRGDYRIEERSRDAAAERSVPVAYADGDGSHWRSCAVLRDADWETQSPPIGMDFADAQEAGDTFPGMNHHSQFKCMVVTDQPRPDVPSEIRRADALDYLGRGAALRMNRCQASGDPELQERNPAVPGFSCAVVPDQDVQAGSVFWAAVPYLDYDPYGKNPGVPETAYTRGCVNECAGQLTSCFGWDTNPAAVNCSYDATDFGRFVRCEATELCDGFDNTGEGSIDDGNPGAGLDCVNDGNPIAPSLEVAGHAVAAPTACAGTDDCSGGFVCQGGKCVAAGQCRPGRTACQGGKVVCEPRVLPGARTEECDADLTDEDCDGRTNESDPSDGKDCDTGLSGVCAAGKNACDAGTGDILCVQQVQALDHEICDGKDWDCDGKADDVDTSPTYNGADCGGNGYRPYYKDVDSDGYGDSKSSPICLCKAGGDNSVAKRDYKILTNTDCCDSGNGAASTRPGQTAWFTQSGCNGYDYNCDGNVTKERNGLSGGGCSACEDSGDSGWLDVATVPDCGVSAEYTGGNCDCGCCDCNTCKSTITQGCH